MKLQQIKQTNNIQKLDSLLKLSNLQSCVNKQIPSLKKIGVVDSGKDKTRQLSIMDRSNPFVLSSSKSLKINLRYKLQDFHWQNQWKNFHLHYKSLFVKNLITNYFIKRKLYVNNFYYHKYHGGLHLKGNTFGFYMPKYSKLLKKYKRHNLKFIKILRPSKYKSFPSKIHKQSFSQRSPAKLSFIKQPKVLKDFLEENQYKNKFSLLAKAIIDYTATSKVCISFTNYYLPRNYIVGESNTVFGRYKKIRNFWEGLQIIRLIVENKAITHVLARFVYISIRRNPKRAAFMMYIKRNIDWHFANTQNLKIQGIRIEVKGRFNAKSRSKKYILSVGRVAKKEKTSQVDFAFIEAITIFGSLAIKVWVCPYYQ